MAKKPCDVISVNEMETITGVKLKDSKSEADDSISVCIYTPDAGGVVPPIAIEGKLPGPYDLVISTFQKTVKADKVEDVKVSGADQAKTFTGSVSGIRQVWVVAVKDEVVYGGVISGSKSASAALETSVKITEALIKG